MAFRVLFVENELSMRLKLNNIIIKKNEKDLWIPINDISIIVIDNLKTNMTTRMLTVLAENNVGIVVCNHKHMPIGFFSAYDNHSRSSKVIKYQIEKTREYYDELWQKIVIQKITNQGLLLKLINLEYEKVIAFATDVLPGDITNREAHAAKVYFNNLMDSTFSRGNENILLNSGLDYGYAIIRSYISRVCVGYGLNTQIGIHHKNEYNRFNLADDLMEPLRPFVDLYAYWLLNDAQYFTAEHRKKLVNMLNHKVIYKNKKMYLCNMIEEYVSNVASYIEGNTEVIVFPDINKYIGEEDEV